MQKMNPAEYSLAAVREIVEICNDNPAKIGCALGMMIFGSLNVANGIYKLSSESFSNVNYLVGLCFLSSMMIMSYYAYKEHDWR